MGQNAPAEASAAPEASAPNVVRLPDGHTVTLYAELTPGMAVAAMALVRQEIVEGIATTFDRSALEAIMVGKLTDVFLGLGIRSWDYTDEKGQMVPISTPAIAERITIANGALEVVNACDALYPLEEVLRPLAARFSPPSPNGPTASSTPPIRSSGSTHEKARRRSSRNGSAGRRSGVPAP